jgi:hypothetical protein
MYNLLHALTLFHHFSFQPLAKKPTSNIELCMCCTWYPYEENEEEMVRYSDELSGHPYLAPTPPTQTSKLSYQPWQDANQTTTQTV